jgi:hypothetical protein
MIEEHIIAYTWGGHFIQKASNFESFKFKLWKLKYRVIILYDILKENMIFQKVQLD